MKCGGVYCKLKCGGVRIGEWWRNLKCLVVCYVATQLYSRQPATNNEMNKLSHSPHSCAGRGHSTGVIHAAGMNTGPVFVMV